MYTPRQLVAKERAKLAPKNKGSSEHMTTGRRRPPARSRNTQEHRMAGLLDDLREFEQYREDVLPEIRRMLKEGASAEKILERFSNMAAARAVTIALTEEDSSKALAAIKDVIDRSQGKAVERKEVKHQFSELKDEELDALLESKLKEAAASESASDDGH